jgi:tight adherence protein B
MISRAAAAGLAVVSGLLLAATPAAGQGSSEGTVQGETLKVTDTTVGEDREVTFTVTGPVELIGFDLSDKIVVRESGQPRDAQIRALPSDDLEVLLLMDTSGSMAGTAMTEAQAAAAAFVDEMPAEVRIAVVGFGTVPTVAADFTTDHDAARAAIAGLVPQGETALYDGLVAAVDLFPAAQSTTRRVLVLLTDGGDTVSAASLGDASAALAGASIPLSIVSLTTVESDNDALAALRFASQGTLSPVADEAALESAFREVAALIVNQYRITFTATGGGPTGVTATVSGGDTYWSGGFIADLPPLPPPPTPLPTPTPTAVPTAEPVTIAAPAVVLGEDPGRTWLLPVGIALLGLALMVVLNLMLWPSRRASILRQYAEQAKAAARGPRRLAPNLQEGLVRASDRMLQAGGRDQRLALRLAQAGIEMRAGEFVALVAILAAVAFLFGLLLDPFFGLFAALVVMLVAWLILEVKRHRRQSALQTQLGPTLQMLAGSLRTGYSLAQATDVVAREADTPMSIEFGRIATENQLGRDLPSAYVDAAVRAGSGDFLWAADAIEINQTVGGDLAELLDNVAGTIRSRESIRRQVKTLTAEGRISALILGALPFVVFAWLLTFNREYAEKMFTTSSGRSVLVLAGILMAVGLTWLFRITKLRY